MSDSKRLSDSRRRFEEGETVQPDTSDYVSTRAARGEGFRPLWPEAYYRDWLTKGLGTKAQQERYRAALDWYILNKTSQLKGA